MTDCARCMEQCGECCCVSRTAVQDAAAETVRYELDRRPNFFVPNDPPPGGYDWNSAQLTELVADPRNEVVYGKYIATRFIITEIIAGKRK